MGGLRPGGALEGMIMRFIGAKVGAPRIAGVLLACLSMLAFLSMVLLPAVADDASDDQAHSYCVQMGYLYRSTPELNGGKGICEFPDRSWCDAQSYLQGTCGPSLSPNIYPAYVYDHTSEPTSSAITLCQRSGGSLRNIHTPYGDVVMCVFPDGTACDLRSLEAGVCSGVDYWELYARAWLNAP